MSTIRQQIKVAVISVMEDAESVGKDPITEARRCFPDFPEAALWECWADWDYGRLEAWWQSMEKTIDAGAANKAALRLVKV